MIVYLGTFGYCIVSALLPFVNAEAYLIGLAAVVDPPNIWLLALFAAAGQMVGKVVYYYAGRGSLQLPRVMRRKQRPGRWTAKLQALRQKAEARPVYAAGLVLLSGFAGLPPFAAVSVLAGVVRLPIWLFMPLGLVGRYGRFAVCLAVPGLWQYLSITS